MALAESLVTAVLRAEGEALVMHVGEKPYVVSPQGPIEISTQPLDAHAMTAVLAELLPDDSRETLDRAGTVQHALPPMPHMTPDQFTVVAARAGEDLWIDIQRHRQVAQVRKERERPAEAPPAPATPHVAPAPATVRSAEVSHPKRDMGPTLAHPDRHEAPGTTDRGTSATSKIEDLLEVAVSRGATALYLTSEAPPFARIDGDVRRLEESGPWSPAEIQAAIRHVQSEAWQASGSGDAVEYTFDSPSAGHVRCCTFRDYRGPGAVLEFVSAHPMPLEQLALSAAAEALASESDGLVLIAGQRMQGKSTVSHSFVDAVNRRRPCYVVVLERQTRLLHTSRLALVSQRELPASDDQALTALGSALAEHPDVVVVDECRSVELFEAALDAAAKGTLMIVTMNYGSVTTALRAMIESLPEDRRQSVQMLLADTLRGCVAQALLRGIGGGRVAAREVLLSTSSVQAVLAEGRFDDIPATLEQGHAHGLRSLNSALVQLVQSGTVDAREAYRKADDREGLLRAFRAVGIDLSAVERLLA